MLRYLVTLIPGAKHKGEAVEGKFEITEAEFNSFRDKFTLIETIEYPDEDAPEPQLYIPTMEEAIEMVGVIEEPTPEISDMDEFLAVDWSEVRGSPEAIKLMQEMEILPSEVVGTGKDGAIKIGDVRKLLDSLIEG